MVTARSLGDRALGPAAAFSLLVLLGGGVAAQPQRVDTSGLASGPFSTMDAKVERTFLGVDVARVLLRVDEPTRRQLEGLIRQSPRSTAQKDQVARTAARGENAFARLIFLRNVSVSEFLHDGQRDLQHAARARMLDPQSYQVASQAFAHAFLFLRSRGFRKGDQLLYRVRPESLRTVLVSATGQVLMDKLDRGAAFPRALMASYFAPGSTLRELLLRSLYAGAAVVDGAPASSWNPRATRTSASAARKTMPACTAKYMPGDSASP